VGSVYGRQPAKSRRAAEAAARETLDMLGMLERAQTLAGT